MIKRASNDLVFNLFGRSFLFLSLYVAYLFARIFTIQNRGNLLSKVNGGRNAHSNPQMTMVDLLDKLCDLAIEKKSAAFRKRCVTKETNQANPQNLRQCENCHSTYALQIDHIIPKAKGGSNNPKNLRILCRSCNQRAAIKEFGQIKMDRFIN